MVPKAEGGVCVLTGLLQRMDADELTALLAARPDVLAPPEPRTFGELAMRLGNEHSVRSALYRLPVPQMQLAEALQALGDGCLRTELERLLGVGTLLDPAVLDGLLDDLRRLGLAWTDGPVLRLAPVMDRMSADPLALGPPAAGLLTELTVDQLAQIASSYGIQGPRRKADWVSTLAGVLADPQQLHRALASAPPGIDEIVEHLVWRSPRAHAPVQLALYGTHSYGLPQEMMWLARRGFLLPSGWDTGQLPREVALALRGADYHPLLQVEPPVPATAEVDPVPVPRVSAVDGVQRMLTLLGTAPARQLVAGGVGVRELRRIARELGGTDSEIRLWLEVAAAAGLLRPDADGELLPSAAADTWLSTPPGAQLVDLITAWLGITAVPSHRVNTEGKPLPALDSGGATTIGPPLRNDLLTLLAEYPRGTAITDLDGLIDLVAWRRPLRYHNAEVLGPYLVATWIEMQHLGLVAEGLLGELGRAVAGGAGDEERTALANRMLPAPVERAAFLPDLSAVVSGPPSAELAELLGTVAEPETRDTASTWRFSPASVRRALDAGHTADGLLARLAEVADRPLPQPLEYLIRDAERRHGLVQVRAMCCAVCTSDPALATEIAAHRQLAELELSLLSATVLGSAKPAEETLRLLRAAGYSPVQQSRTGKTLIERIAPRRAPDRAPDRAPARRRGAPAPVSPAVLAHRLISGNITTSPSTSCEQEVRVNAKALDDAQARLLAHAIEHRTPVLIDYVSASGGRTRRVIEPMALFFDAIQAWCRLRNGERVFRLDRICAVAPAT